MAELESVVRELKKNPNSRRASVGASVSSTSSRRRKSVEETSKDRDYSGNISDTVPTFAGSNQGGTTRSVSQKPSGTSELFVPVESNFSSSQMYPVDAYVDPFGPSTALPGINEELGRLNVTDNGTPYYALRGNTIAPSQLSVQPSHSSFRVPTPSLNSSGASFSSFAADCNQQVFFS